MKERTMYCQRDKIGFDEEERDQFGANHLEIDLAFEIKIKLI